MKYLGLNMHTISAIHNVANDSLNLYLLFFIIASVYDFGIQWFNNVTNAKIYNTITLCLLLLFSHTF